MTDEPTIWQRLAAPFPPDVVKRRPGAKARDGNSAMVLHYIDARDVQHRLDDVMGAENWSDSYTVLADNAVQCHLALAVFELDAPKQWIVKSDVGYPNSAGDPEPLKGAFSDALKRAGVRWGIGRSLYGMPQEWLPIDANGRFLDADAPAPAAAPPQRPPAPTQRPQAAQRGDEPPPPDDAAFGDVPARDVTADVSGPTNKWGDAIGNTTCPQHGSAMVKISKRDGGGYFDRQKNPIGHCFVEVNATAENVWDMLCWGDLPLIPAGGIALDTDDGLPFE